MTKPLLFAALLVGAPALADDQTIPVGDHTLTPAQIGHVFVNACVGSVPTLIERRAATTAAALGWEAIDLGTDAGWLDPRGAIALTVDGNPIETACTMSMPTDAAGDLNALQDSLTAHLAEALGDNLPVPQEKSDGREWRWTDAGATYTVEIYMGEAIQLSLMGES